MQLGQFEKAEVSIKKLISIKPDEPYVYQTLASDLKDQDKLEEAESVINQGLKNKLIIKAKPVLI